MYVYLVFDINIKAIQKNIIKSSEIFLYID
jgi:hypothetical protein